MTRYPTLHDLVGNPSQRDIGYLFIAGHSGGLTVRKTLYPTNISILLSLFVNPTQGTLAQMRMTYTMNISENVVRQLL